MSEILTAGRAPRVHAEVFALSGFNPYIISVNPVADERRALRVGKISDVAFIVKLAPSTIRAKMRVGEFPPSKRLSYKSAVWNLDEVEAWFLEKLKAAPVYVPHLRPKSNGFAVAGVANA